MADTRPTKLKFSKIIYFCCLAITHPKKFIKEEENDNEVRKNFPPTSKKEHNIYVVRRVFWSSLRSICGVTLAERVNQWIYRSLYCLRTGIIICSLIWDFK